MNVQWATLPSSQYQGDQETQSQLALIEKRFLTALKNYFTPWQPPNCRWSLLYFLWEKSREYPATEEELRTLLIQKYTLINECEKLPWDITIWHSIIDSSRILHAGLVTDWWMIKSREWAEVWDEVTIRTVEELTDIIESDCRKLNWRKLNGYYTTVKYYRKK